MPWVKSRPCTPTPRCHPIPGAMNEAQCLPCQVPSNATWMPSWGQGYLMHVLEGAAEPSRQPYSCRDSLQSPAALCHPFWGLSFFGKWGCGQSSACTMGCQEDSQTQSHAHGVPAGNVLLPPDRVLVK